jgi:hypothetical protein
MDKPVRSQERLGMMFFCETIYILLVIATEVIAKISQMVSSCGFKND